MADTTAPARRINRVIGVMTAIVMVTATTVALTVDNPGAPSGDTVPDGSPSPTGTGARPAETSLSWFDHSMSVEQFDYDMKSLSCESVAAAITPDLCAVARSPHGEFMLVGSEGFWDPAEVDEEGFAHISLNLSVFTMRDDQDAPRAISVLDGTIDHRYSSAPVRVDVFTATIGGTGVLVLHKHLADPKADAYSSWDEVQVLTASTTGAPTVVATYSGAQLRVTATADGIVFSNLRYRASGTSAGSDWYSRVTLTPAKSSPTEWTETITSASTPVSSGNGLSLVDTYQFPVRATPPTTARA